MLDQCLDPATIHQLLHHPRCPRTQTLSHHPWSPPGFTSLTLRLTILPLWALLHHSKSLHTSNRLASHPPVLLRRCTGGLWFLLETSNPNDLQGALTSLRVAISANDVPREVDSPSSYVTLMGDNLPGDGLPVDQLLHFLREKITSMCPLALFPR